MADDNRLKYAAVGMAVVAFILVLGLAIGSSGDESSDGIEGRDWVVRRVTVGDASGSSIEGTNLTATFSDGELSGSAGCNTYFGSYEIEGDSLSIGPLASTEIFCAEPPRAMDQEQAYLSLLQSMERIQQSGDELALLGDDSEILFDAG